jgi:hypothetical protein
VTRTKAPIPIHRSADAAPAGRGARSALQAMADASPPVRRLQALAPTGRAPLQAMAIRGGASPSVVSGTTHTKHVKATGDQAAAAAGNFGSTTFVTSDAALTSAVDAHAHDFTEAAGKASARFDFNADVAISQYSKTEAPPDGFAKGKPVTKDIDNAVHSCEIGATKGGDDKIKVTHFKKL